MALQVVTHNGSLPTTRGGTGHRIGYRVDHPNGGFWWMQIGQPMVFVPPPPPPLPSFHDLPMAFNVYGACVKCPRSDNPTIKKLFREGVLEVVKCGRCGTLMRPRPWY
ncbi:MAG: hypothetical protein PHH01_02675 [Patescibacteria group bacterium]|nr:hypothetical protein [Patescibacteria group bacterium]